MTLNILALVLVVLFLWGSIWLYSRLSTNEVKSRRKDRDPLDGEFEVEWDTDTDELNCPECGGVGGAIKMGRLQACKICEGTGVARSNSFDS